MRAHHRGAMRAANAVFRSSPATSEFAGVAGRGGKRAVGRPPALANGGIVSTVSFDLSLGPCVASSLGTPGSASRISLRRTVAGLAAHASAISRWWRP